jgi:DNA-binding LacI/PurR family transcriptional regulator
MKTTLQDISNRTGLSVSTISRVLRGEAKLGSDNVNLVIETAQELNYQVNNRLLNKTYNYKKKLQIALLTNFYNQEFYSTLFKGISEAASTSNAHLCLYDVTDNDEPLEEFIQFLIKHSIDAVILFITDLSEKAYNKLIKKIPADFTILSIAPVFHRIIDTVTFDSYMGGYMVAKHFEDRGYKEVGIIVGPTDRHEALLRKSGFTDYVTHNSKMKLVWSFNGDYTPSSGMAAFDDFEKTATKPRAIFASNDYMGMGFIKSANKANVDIPNEVAIVGYDDLTLCNYLHPTLSSVHTDYQELGKTVISMVHEKVQKREAQKGLFNLVPVSLTVRDSS